MDQSPNPVTDTRASPAQALKQSLMHQGYVADDSLVSSLYLMQALNKPLLLEGDAGVGKTEVAKVLAQALGTTLIRLQCYEGLDSTQALYDWDYQRQLLAIQMAGNSSANNLHDEIYSDRYLLQRPLLKAIRAEQPVVLLIDEIDRADEEFEAFLLELLSDYQISIPELGTVTAASIPWVLLTSNGVRELSDALRRRCLYHYIDYPDQQKELSILQTRLPDLNPQLAQQIVNFVQNLRTRQLNKTPGIAESLDWAAALANLQVSDLQQALDSVETTLSCIVKTREDLQLLQETPDFMQSLIAPEHEHNNQAPAPD
ncbi:MAG: MoxR family ATPase [Gammaproteobacteria bacterium]|nr:MoxR family ATPase [Gammaproteobacteria bacterium]